MRTRINRLVRSLSAAAAPGLLFNHYAREMKAHDAPGGARQRCRNLARYLEWVSARGPELLLIGEAAGYQGCRFTGIAFTSEWTITHDPTAEALGLVRTGTRERLWKEPSGTMVWQLLARLERPFVLWNAVPFHPHQPGRPLSNRPPARAEREACLACLRSFLDLFPHAAVVAVGNQAAETLAAAALPHHRVRHPSHGGKAAFTTGVLRLARAH